EAIADRVIDDAIVAFAVGPVGEAPARELTRGGQRPQAFIESIDPFELAGTRVERDDRAPRARRRVHHAADHDWRPFELVLGSRDYTPAVRPNPAPASGETRFGARSPACRKCACSAS